jgi:histidyl-tRNA synthetase
VQTISRVKGTQDFIDLTLYSFIINEFEKQAQLYHFNRIETPILERVDLFKRSLGLHTDIVSKEMFVIDTADKDEQICLRPEATASTMRAFIEHKPLTPWKVYSFGPMFRYERPQKGRFRQFHQINMELIGSPSIAQDAQLITMLDRFFHEKLMLNNYALQINFLGSYEDRAAYYDVLRTYLEKVDHVCTTCLQRKERNLMRIFDCKSEQCQEIFDKAPKIVDHLNPASKKEWEKLQEDLSLLSVSFSYNPKLVRGLDYYNKTVFEFVSNDLGAQNAFCGGGRYDRLSIELGDSQEHPALGAAIGIERLMIILEPMRDKLPLPQPAPLYVIMPLSEEQNPLALLLADTLHAANRTTDTLLEGDSLKSMMRKTNKMGAAYALILVDEEQQNRSVLVKNMMNGQQEQVAQIDLVNYLGH